MESVSGVKTITSYAREIIIGFLVIVCLIGGIKIKVLYDGIKIEKLKVTDIAESSSGLRDHIKLLNEEIKSFKEQRDSSEQGNSFVCITKKTLVADMKNRFPKFSEKVRTIIVNTVLEEANKYGMNPVILYSLGVVESSHRYWIEHAKVNIYLDSPDGKKVKKSTQAVGWGGVIWEWHDKLLKEKGIAESRADLFFPDVNIKATAAIYNMFYHMPLKKGVTNRDVSAQRRYFGGNYKAYSDRIYKQVIELVKNEIYRTEEPKPEKKVAKKKLNLKK